MSRVGLFASCALPCSYKIWTFTPRQKQNKKYEQNDAECIGNQAFPEIHFVTQRNFGNGYV